MLETILLLLVATGGVVMLATRLQNTAQSDYPPRQDFTRVLSPIAQGGLYSLSSPGSHPQVNAFSNLHLAHSGLMWRDDQSGVQHILDFAQIQWVSAVTVNAEDIASLTIHAEIGGRWRILHLQLPEGDMALLVRVLKRVLPATRTNLGQTPAHPIGPIQARLTNETLQGQTNVGAEVGLYLLPHLLIVLDGDRVQAKLDMSSIRRVLAVERISGMLDTILPRSTPEGIVRLYSMYETASFALPQYRELAQEISYLSRCPVEFITQDEKTDKT